MRILSISILNFALGLICAIVIGLRTASAAEPSLDERRVLIARDVCAGFAANFATTQGGSISFSAGHFRVEGSQGTVTIFEGDVRLTEIPGFSYSTYNDCLDKVLSRLERTRKAEDSKRALEAFNASFELNQLLSTGICLQSAAKGGFYFGNLDQGGVPLEQRFLSEFLTVVAKSVERRLVVFSGQHPELSLADGLKFYRYVPGRAVPYFDQITITRENAELSGAASAELEGYLAIGGISGQMRTVYEYIVGLTDLLQSGQGRFDERSVRLKTTVPPSLSCLWNAYRSDKEKLLREIKVLSIEGIVDVPNPMNATVASVSIGGEFDDKVTVRLRKYLRENR